MRILVLLVLLSVSHAARAATDQEIWLSFRDAFRQGAITSDRVRPYVESIREALLTFIDNIRREARPEDWEQKPEMHRVGKQLHFLIPLTAGNGEKVTYCFTVVEDGDTWFFQHLESIFIRLDRVGPLPATQFPDVSESHKNWMREEIAMTERLRMFLLLTREKGKPFAFSWFKDGAGYFLAARTWVPFVTPARAFILYACWEQSKLRGRPVTLRSLDDEHAIIELDSGEWRLYEQTAHLRNAVSRDDYRMLVETIWQDRAAAAGWRVRMEHNPPRIQLRFDRVAQP